MTRIFARIAGNRSRPLIGVRLLWLLLLLPLTGPLALSPTAARAEEFQYLIGCGSHDITGPAVGVQMFGFVRADQISEGVHLRQRARTFIIAEPAGQRRLVLTTVDLGSVTHEITRSVLDALRDRFGETYHLANVVIAATHTHAAPGGFWHYGANTPLGGPLYEEYFRAIVDGIVASIVQAHEDLQPGNVLIATGEVQNAGAQRSAPAYLNNPADERARYETDTDRQMTLLKFERADGAIGTLNWFAVHPTSMTYNNRLISTDNKGYAAHTFERQMQPERASFVAAFAQTNCGDVTPNLNLDNTGPGKDEFESTRIIGQRQLDVARELFATARTPLSGPIDYRHQYVDFSQLTVADEFTGAGPQHTCPSAYGYAFAAGSTEDGGGHPLFKEGMTERNPLIDGLARQMVPLPPPSDALRQCHLPKAILFAPGAADPPAQPQIQPLGIARVGQLVLVIGTAEFTTMTGRRIRQAVRDQLGEDVHVVIAGFANGYSGYLTTFEEYQTQQYEGGHTLYGPWSEAGYRQQYTLLARSLASGSEVSPGPTPPDIRDEVEKASLATPYDKPPAGAEFGDLIVDAEASYQAGEQVAVSFWTGTPRNDYRSTDQFLAIERQEPDGLWRVVATDADWETKCRFHQPPLSDEAAGNSSAETADSASGGASPTSGQANRRATAAPPSTAGGPLAAPAGPPRLDAHQVTITWDIPETVEPGTYRVVHFGRWRRQEDGQVQRFTAHSRSFEVR